MSPEQCKGNEVLASDLYSLGITLLCLLTHRSPSDLSNNNDEIDVAKCLQNSQLSEDIINWLSRMIEKDLEIRFNSAQKSPQSITSTRTNFSTIS